MVASADANGFQNSASLMPAVKIGALCDRRVIPGLVAFSLFGYLGQLAYNVADQWHARRRSEGPKRAWTERIMESKWMPIKALTDEKYKEILHEKALGLEVEIALIDERIKALRESQISGRSEK
ncbi:hypothetical protein PRK78_006731 [Emydomyces testavorans]|uniref:Uncharacterized protein n=1 Tax=Emydomyces testavorans TaxID=2070801 RepID=A0AAF0ILZ9_9EURO|nr:hypothetical protein PRK78_006731 [Emydomyces testavorans]